MPKGRVATAYVEIRPDTDGFARELARELSRVHAEKAVQIVADVNRTAFTASLRRQLASVDVDEGVGVQPDVTGFAQQLTAKLHAINLPEVSVTVVPDLDTFAERLRATLARTNLPSIKIPVEIEDSTLERAGANARTAIAKIGKDSGGNFITNLVDRIASSGGMVGTVVATSLSSPITAAMLALAAASAITFVSALTGAVLELGAGLSLIGVGLLGAAQTEPVKAAAQSLADRFWKDLGEATSAFKPFTIVALNVLSNSIQRSFETLKPVFDALAPLLPDLAKGLGDAMQILASQLAKPEVIAAMVSLVKTLATELPGVAAVLGVILERFAQHGPEIEAALKGLFRSLELGLIVFTAFAEVLMYQMRAVAAVVTAVVDFAKAAWTKAGEMLTAGIETAKEILNGFRDWLDKILHPQWALDLGAKFIGGLVSGVTSMAGSVTSAITGLLSNITTPIRNLLTGLYNLGRDAIQGLIDGIKGMGSTLWNAVTALVKENIPEAVRKVLKMGSPSKLMMALGEDTVEGYAIGMKRGWQQFSPRIDYAGVGTLAAMGPSPVNLTAVLEVDGDIFDMRVKRMITTNDQTSARGLFAGRTEV